MRILPRARRSRAAAVFLAFALTAPGAGAVSLGQLDTFESGTTEGWVVALLGSPHPAPPSVVASGGPAGADDAFLQLQSVGGGGPGSRFAVINRSQWAGDYPGAGITAIRIDVSNLGSSDLSLRLLFSDALAGPPTHVAFSSDPLFVPAGSGWVSLLFPVSAGALMALQGSVDAALANVAELRLFHSVADTFPGEAIVATLGVDNLLAVPEPGAAALLGFGIAGLSVRTRGAGRRLG